MQRHDAISILRDIYCRTQQYTAARSSEDDQISRICGCLNGTDIQAYPCSDSVSAGLALALRGLNRRFAICMRNSAVQIAVDSTNFAAKHIPLDYDSIQILEDLSLVRYAERSHCAAFIRDDCTLIVWADSIESLVSNCQSIQTRLEQRYLRSRASAGNPLLLADGGDGLDLDQFIREDAFLTTPSSDGQPEHVLPSSLSSLPGLSYLPTLPATAPTPSPLAAMIATSYNTDSNSSKPHTAARYSSPTAALSESFKGLRASASPWSVSSTLSSSTNNSPFPQSNLPMTICLADISPPPISPGYQQLFEEESEVPAETDTCDHPPSVIPTEAPEDFCSSSESEDEKPLASASVPTRRAVGQKSKRASRDVESDGEDDDDDYVPRPQVRGAPSNLRKRIRAHYVLPKLEPELVSSVAGPTSTLTPALCAASMQPATPAPVLPELSAASPAPFCDESDDDTVMSPPATSAYKPKKKRRTARRQNNKAKLPRAKCAFCPKQFGRPKDRDRHEVYSCELNPNKAGSLCEECGELLSRPDSAQRHLKVHQSRGLPPPTVLSRL